MQGIDRFLKVIGFTLPLPQSRQSKTDIVLNHGPVMRSFLSRHFLKNVAPRIDRLPQHGSVDPVRSVLVQGEGTVEKIPLFNVGMRHWNQRRR
jgi:hypothetical protein